MLPSYSQSFQGSQVRNSGWPQIFYVAKDDSRSSCLRFQSAAFNPPCLTQKIHAWLLKNYIKKPVCEASSVLFAWKPCKSEKGGHWHLHSHLSSKVTKPNQDDMDESCKEAQMCSFMGSLQPHPLLCLFDWLVF